jgi:hypothetical protein
VSDSDQLAALGQRVLDAVTATYNPHGDPSLALALHPGQALADDVVQNGVTNELRLSMWLQEQYDFPLWLKEADGSSISASTVGGVTAKAAYTEMVPYAQPSVPVDAPAYPRISALIAQAREDLGENPEALPLGCEPTDFAEPDSAAWHTFDATVTSSSATETTGTAPEQGVRINPQLWKMRALTTDVLTAQPAPPAPPAPQAAAGAPWRVRFRPELMRARIADMEATPAVTTPLVVADLAPGAPVDAPAMASPAASLLHLARLDHQALAVAMPVQGVAVQPVLAEALRSGTNREVEPPRFLHLDATVAQRLSNLQLADLATQPTVEQTTTSDSLLHVHFEYCKLTITRDLAGVPWWHPELVHEDDWYVPGMRRGDMVPAATEDGYARCLPQALLLVRNVQITGSWTDQAREVLNSAVTYLGPFLMQAPTTSTTTTTTESSTEQVTVLGLGVQVIGELCAPLPALPPRDDPTLTATPATG